LRVTYGSLAPWAGLFFTLSYQQLSYRCLWFIFTPLNNPRMEFLDKLFDSDFMPHGHCYFWKPEVLWVHVIGDALTALAYFLIPFGLYYFVRKR